MTKAVTKAKYSVLTGLQKSVWKMIVLGGPILLTVLPEQWMNVTLGVALAFMLNYAKNRNQA